MIQRNCCGTLIDLRSIHAAASWDIEQVHKTRSVSNCSRFYFRQFVSSMASSSLDEKFRPKIFISYKWDGNKNIVRGIAKELKEKNDVWIDIKKLHGHAAEAMVKVSILLVNQR